MAAGFVSAKGLTVDASYASSFTQHDRRRRTIDLIDLANIVRGIAPVTPQSVDLFRGTSRDSDLSSLASLARWIASIFFSISFARSRRFRRRDGVARCLLAPLDNSVNLEIYR